MKPFPLRPVRAWAIVVLLGVIGGAIVAGWRMRHAAEDAARREREAEERLAGRRAVLVAAERQKRALSDLLHKESIDTDEREILAAPTLDPKSRSVFRNPKIRAQRLKSLQETLTYFWGPLMHKLNLSPAAAARFQHNLLEREEGSMDLQALQEVGKISESEGEALMADVGAHLSDTMQALLPPEQFQEFAAYNHVKFVSNWLEALAVDSYATSTPLTADQAHRLVNILADPGNHDPALHTPAGQAAAFIHFDDARWDRLMPQAAAVLSPQQYADFERMRQSAVAKTEAVRLTNQLLAAVGAADSRR